MMALNRENSVLDAKCEKELSDDVCTCCGDLSHDSSIRCRCGGVETGYDGVVSAVQPYVFDCATAEGDGIGFFDNKFEDIRAVPSIGSSVESIILSQDADNEGHEEEEDEE